MMVQNSHSIVGRISMLDKPYCYPLVVGLGIPPCLFMAASLWRIWLIRHNLLQPCFVHTDVTDNITELAYCLHPARWRVCSPGQYWKRAVHRGLWSVLGKLDYNSGLVQNSSLHGMKDVDTAQRTDSAKESSDSSTDAQGLGNQLPVEENNILLRTLEEKSVDVQGQILVLNTPENADTEIRRPRVKPKICKNAAFSMDFRLPSKLQPPETQSITLKKVLQIVGHMRTTESTEELILQLQDLSGIPARELVILLKLVPDIMVFPLYRWVKAQLLSKPDPLVCLVVYRRLLSAHEWEKLGELVDEMRQHNLHLDTKAYCRIIREISDSGPFFDGDKWLQKMKAHGCQLDTIVYNTLMHGYVKRRMHERVFSTFAQMQESNARPDMFTYCHLLSSCRSTGNILEARRLFNELKSSTIKCNHVPSSILLDLYGKVGNPAEAAKLLQSMKAEGFQPDAISYTSLLDAYAKAGMVDQATLAFQEILGSRCAPDKVLFWAMVSMYCKANRPEKAVEIMEIMRHHHIIVNEDCYYVLMNAYVNLGRWEDAVRLLKDWQISGCPISEKSCSLMFLVLFKSGQHVACERLFQQMVVRKGYKNIPSIYETMVDMYCKTKRCDQAMSMYRCMKANGCLPSVSILSSLINLNAGNGLVLQMLWKELKQIES